MYRRLARRRVRRVFDGLSRGDYETALAGLAEDVHHRFAGSHPLGGERHSRQAVRTWFERLFRLFPSLRFAVLDVAVAGPPWAMTLTVQWRAEVSPLVGPTYMNVGAHVLDTRLGRVVRLSAYEDSQAVAEACRVMAEHGVAEARADPIQD